MIVNIPYGHDQIKVSLPDYTTVYYSSYPEPMASAPDLVLRSVRNPIRCEPLAEKLRISGAQSVVIVVSDITRPIPYADFLSNLLEEIEIAEVLRENITILVATGMHRPSTIEEREFMLGSRVCKRYCIIDHQSEKRDDLVMISGKSWAGRPIELNRHFLAADFRVITGLVEPHFMAGFSGGRKAVCPGLCSLETIKAFHSFAFLDDPSARNGNLEANPLHEEALSIARQANIDFCLNLIVDREHRLIEAVSGELEASHQATCEMVRRYACPRVKQQTDVVLTSCGGHPLDATFYQCVKGMVASLPAVRRGGTIVSLGSCSEGIGGSEYRDLMFEYAGRWREFLKFIKSNDITKRDQWELQMQTKVLDHVGDGNLIFVTDGLSASDLNRLSVNGIHAAESDLQKRVQELVDGFVREGRSLAVIPEGPYCTPFVQGWRKV